jgi:hypothetical protein
MGPGTFIVAAIFHGVVRGLTPAPAKDSALMRRALPNVERHQRESLANTLPLSRAFPGFAHRAVPAALSIQASLVYRRGSSAIVAHTPVSVRDA